MNKQALNGEVGLILAIIDQAVRDIDRPAYRGSALRYFASAWYRNHVTHLGLPPDILPTAVANGRKRGPGRRSEPVGGNVAAAATGEKSTKLNTSVGAKV